MRAGESPFKGLMTTDPQRALGAVLHANTRSEVQPDIINGGSAATTVSDLDRVLPMFPLRNRDEIRSSRPVRCP